ncbi:hypothetical protein AHAS_Ahas10G0094100 [Arachis hypogaea]
MNYRRILQGFKFMFGLKINYEKLVVIKLNCKDEEVKKACKILGCCEAKLLI